MEMKRVGSLLEGTLFTVEQLTARVVRSNECRTLVQVAGGQNHKIVTRDGLEVEFDAPGARVSISPGTMVTLIEEEEDLLGLPLQATHVSRGGKPALPQIIRPIRRSKKIGQVLEWLMQGPKTISAMSERFGITKGCSMSYLAVLNKAHGIGYVVSKDTVYVTIPIGCADPFIP